MVKHVTKVKKPIAKAKNPRQVSRSVVAVNTKESSSSSSRLQGVGKGNTVVKHREVILSTLPNNSSFTVNASVILQPGLATDPSGTPMGTWIPNVAQRYDNYKFRRLDIRYTTSCSAFTNGTVVLAYEPNPDGLAPTSFADARNYAFVANGPARENLTLNLTAPLQKKGQLYVRDGPVTSKMLYDGGKIHICTMGADAGNTSPVGYVEVEYEIELINPQTGPRNQIPPSVSNVAPPTVMFVDTNQSPTLIAFGTTVAGRNAVRPLDYFTNGVRWGDSALLTVFTCPNIGTSGSLVASGVTYSWDANTAAVKTFRLSQKGRYRCRALLGGDFQDYAMFGASVLQVTSLGVPTAAPTDRTFDLSGNPVSLPVMAGYWRGFTNPSTTYDDVAGFVEQTFYVSDPTQNFGFCIGVRNNTSVSESGTATWTSQPATGPSFFAIEYLGDV